MTLQDTRVCGIMEKKLIGLIKLSGDGDWSDPEGWREKRDSS